MSEKNKNSYTVEDVLDYWKNSGVATYNDKNKMKRSFSVALRRYIPEKTSGTLHEFGCNIGMNLKLISECHNNLILSGNDIAKNARKHHYDCFDFYEDDTASFIEKMNPVDYIITMAHLVHMPPEFNEALKLIPQKFKKFLIIAEQNKLKHKLGPTGKKFARLYDEFWPELELIEKTLLETSYTIFVFKHRTIQ